MKKYLYDLKVGDLFSYHYDTGSIYRVEDEEEDQWGKIRVKRVAFWMQDQWHHTSGHLEHNHNDVPIHPATLHLVCTNGIVDSFADTLASILVANEEAKSPSFFEKLDDALRKKGFSFRLEQKGIHGTAVSLEPCDLETFPTSG